MRTKPLVGDPLFPVSRDVDPRSGLISCLLPSESSLFNPAAADHRGGMGGGGGLHGVQAGGFFKLRSERFLTESAGQGDADATPASALGPPAEKGGDAPPGRNAPLPGHPG